jgi:FAD/FMN-containing dehydrogenase
VGALDKILEFGETFVRAQAGVRVGTLVRALAERGLELPLTPEMGQISLGALAVTTCRRPPTARAWRSCPPASPN